MDIEDLLSARPVGAWHTHLDLETPRAEQRGIHKLRSVGEPHHENILERIHAIHLGEQLVDHRIADARRVTRKRAALARECVDLVKHDDVEGGGIPLLLLLELCLRKQRSDELLAVAHVPVWGGEGAESIALRASSHISHLAGVARGAAPLTWTSSQGR